MDKINVGGLQTVNATRAELSEWIVERCMEARSHSALNPALIFSSNGQGIAMLGNSVDYDTAMKAADIIHADGMSVVLGSRFFASKGLKERIATTDFFHDVARASQLHGLRFFIMGGTEEQNNRVTASILKMYPRLKIVGRQHGFFNSEDADHICKRIVDAKTDVLWVGLGKPMQEIWSHKYQKKLCGVGCIKTCGGLYAFLNGEVKRAPEWMQRLSLEWLYRAMLEPRRLLFRYLKTNFIALYRIVFKSS